MINWKEELMEKHPDRLQITELFMAQASQDRRFYGTIKRLTDDDGIDYCFGKIKVNNGFNCTHARDDKELREKLDEIVLWTS